jgi:hypothetical protein
MVRYSYKERTKKGKKMKIFAVSEPYEAPCEYFSTREGAEAYVAECERYAQALDAFHASNATEFDESSFTEAYYAVGSELMITELEVR